MRCTFPKLAILSIALIAPAFLQSISLGADEKAEPPGLGDPGKLTAIQAETGRMADGKFTLAGRDSAQQVVVTGQYDSGQVRDLSRDVTYEVTPAGIVSVDETGYVSSIKEGEASIHVSHPSGLDTQLKVAVSNITADLPINFANKITPIFTKYGCNSGGCHGKSGGQNGFRLSLLGFEPPEDFEYLVKEARGRRLFPSAPERSLLLLKGTGASPHGGGARFDVGSPPYRLLTRWMQQGLPYGSDDDPKVVGIDVFPKERLMGREASQQLVVVAQYSDGSTEDVTRTTQFDSNDTEMAECSVTGLVTTARLTGSVAVMARYQGHVGVFRATVPLGIEVKNLPQSKSYIDELVFKKLKALGLPASAIADDTTFLRRVTIDIAGRLPSLEEAEAFLIDKNPNKREVAIDRLLSSTDYAEYFANKWGAVLRNKRRQTYDRDATFAFHDWIRESFHQNKPYDQFAREILAATGTPGKNPPVAWYKEVKDASAQVEDTAQLFLGLRIQCARCHHHPFEKWSQQDYYGFQAFFATVSRKKGMQTGYERIYYRTGAASAKNPKTNENVPPTGLGAEPQEILPSEDPRQFMVDWMASPDNKFFAYALTNRYWKHFFGRGLVDPEDDMRVTNPASNPELLDALSQDFIKSGFDLKHLIRTVCNSQVYQLSAEPNEWNSNDKQNFSRYFPKRLNAEVLLDAIDQVTGVESRFSGAPAGMRAVALPDNGFTSYFLTVFGRPEASSACECERSGEANLAQSLHLLNSSEIQGKLTSGAGLAARYAGQKDRSDAEKLRELYLLTFSREPSQDELDIAVAHIEKNKDNAKVAFEDIVWALVNTKEFLFNH